MTTKLSGRNFVADLIDGGVIKNIVILVTGAASVQFLNLVIMPLLTRLYGADEFGALGLYSSILNLLVVVLGLSYPLAIVLIKDAEKSKYMVEIAFRVTLFMSLFLSVFCCFLAFSYELPFNNIVGYLILGLVPSGFSVVYTQVLVKQSKFKSIAIVGFTSALVVGAAKVFFGLFYLTEVSLIFAVLIGIFVNAILMHFILYGKSSPIKRFFFNTADIAVMGSYVQFPKYRLPHALNAALSQLIPVYLLTSYFGVQAAGYFFLTRSVLMVPVNIIGKAVYDVAYQKLSSDFGNKSISLFLLGSTLSLLALSFIPMVILFFWGDAIFSLVFGEEWSKAGVYAGCMSFWFAINLSNRTCVAAVSLLKLDRFLLGNGVINLVVSSAGFIVGYSIWSTDTAAIFLFYLFAMVAQLSLIFKVIYEARKIDKTLLQGGGFV